MKPGTNIFGVGTDILEIARFQEVLKEHGQKFLEKLFLKSELEYCLRFKDPLCRYAARFCAKEAVAKSLGVGFGKDLLFHDIEIGHDLLGKPLVNLSKKSSDVLNHPQILISISHCKLFATATAIALKREG